MKKRTIFIISIVIILIFASLAVFAPVSVDKFLWGDSFEEYVMENDLNDLRYLIGKENYGWIKGEKEPGYYYNLYNAYGMPIIDVDTSEFDYETHIKNSIFYNGRHIYMTAYFMYEGEIHEIRFEGTRWFFGKYSWRMLDNEFFPIKDSNFYNDENAVVKE